jgi:hypothetical protein
MFLVASNLLLRTTWRLHTKGKVQNSAKLRTAYRFFDQSQKIDSLEVLSADVSRDNYSRKLSFYKICTAARALAVVVL